MPVLLLWLLLVVRVWVSSTQGRFPAFLHFHCFPHKVGVTASPKTLDMVEGGDVAYIDVSLPSMPQSSVTVAVAVSDPSVISVDPASLTFTPDDYTPQSVTVTAVDNQALDGTRSANITLTASSADSNFQGAQDEVTVAVTSEDVVRKEGQGHLHTKLGGHANGKSCNYICFSHRCAMHIHSVMNHSFPPIPTMRVQPTLVVVPASLTLLEGGADNVTTIALSHPPVGGRRR